MTSKTLVAVKEERNSILDCLLNQGEKEDTKEDDSFYEDYAKLPPEER